MVELLYVNMAICNVLDRRSPLGRCDALAVLCKTVFCNPNDFNLIQPVAASGQGKHSVVDLDVFTGAAPPKRQGIVLRAEIRRYCIGGDLSRVSGWQLGPFRSGDLSGQEHAQSRSPCATSVIASRSQGTGSVPKCDSRTPRKCRPPQCSAACNAASRICTSPCASTSRTRCACQFASPISARLRQRNIEAAKEGAAALRANRLSQSSPFSVASSSSAMICSPGWVTPSSSGLASNAFHSTLSTCCAVASSPARCGRAFWLTTAGRPRTVPRYGLDC